MTDNVEDYLLLMGNHLKKIHRYKTSADAKHNKQSDGKIEISSQRSSVTSHEARLSGFLSKAELLQMNQTRYAIFLYNCFKYSHFIKFLASFYNILQ